MGYIKKHYSKMERRDFFFAYMLVLFPVFQFIVFWVVVNASSIAYAFQNDATGQFTLENFKTVYNQFFAVDVATGKLNPDTSLVYALGRSFTLWIIGEGILFPITLITTYVLTRKILGHYIFRLIYIIPSLMGSIIWVILVQRMVNTGGPIIEICKELNISLPAYAAREGLLGDPKTAFPTLVIVRCVMGVVGNNAVLTGAYTRVPTELFESAELDGANFSTELFNIAIPCIWSTICTLLTFALCSVFTCDYNVYLFTNELGNNHTATIGFRLFKITRDLSQGTIKEYGYPAALGVVLTSLTLPIVLLGKWGLEKMSENVEV